MIDQAKMRALAAKLRERDEFNSMHGDPILLDAADAIDLLLAEVEASDQKRKEAILDAEKARDERNRAHVKLNAEWIEKTNTLRAELQAAAADKLDAERWRMEMALRNDPKVAIMFLGTENRCRIFRSGILVASGGTYAESIDAALAQRQGEGS